MLTNACRCCRYSQTMRMSLLKKNGNLSCPEVVYYRAHQRRRDKVFGCCVIILSDLACPAGHSLNYSANGTCYCGKLNLLYIRTFDYLVFARYQADPEAQMRCPLFCTSVLLGNTAAQILRIPWT